MSRIISVIPNEDYTLIIEFENGNKILFDMHDMIKTLPYSSLKDIKLFGKVEFGDKIIFWRDTGIQNSVLSPVRLTLDNILFAMRD